MKIAGKNPIINTQVKLQKANRELKIPGGSSVAGGNGTTTVDKVNLSGKAKKLAHLRKLIAASPDVRKEKIEQIKNALDEGKYNVKASRVAEGIIKKAISFYNHHSFPS